MGILESSHALKASSMGESALKSHSQREKHKQTVKLSGKQVLEKKCDLSLKGPWKVLEKKGPRSAWTIMVKHALKERAFCHVDNC